MPPASPIWPCCNSAFLQDMLAALRLRSKAIRRHAHMACSCAIEETQNGPIERLNIDLSDMGLPAQRRQTRLSLWEDGVLWLRVCVAGTGRNSGWAFLDHFHADRGNVSPAGLVARLEDTLALDLGEDSISDRERLRRLWQAADAPRS